MVWAHNMFNHVPTEGLLGCFQLRAITNKAAMNVCMQVFLREHKSSLLDKCPRVQLLGCMEIECLVS